MLNIESLPKSAALLVLASSATLSAAGVVETGFYRHNYQYAALNGEVDEKTQTDTSGYGTVWDMQYTALVPGSSEAAVAHSSVTSEFENAHYNATITTLGAADYAGFGGTDPMQCVATSEITIDFTITGTESFVFRGDGYLESFRAMGSIYAAIESLSSPYETDRVFINLSASDSSHYFIFGGTSQINGVGELSQGNYRFVFRSSVNIDTNDDLNNSIVYGGSNFFNFDLAITTNSVPAPSSLAMLGLGLVGCTRRRRR